LTNISSELDPEVYDVPITLKTYVPTTWDAAVLSRIGKQADLATLKIKEDNQGPFVLYSVTPGEHDIILEEPGI